MMEPSCHHEGSSHDASEYLYFFNKTILRHTFQGKEEVQWDENYAVLEKVAAGEMVFIDYKNGVSPQIEIKYTKANKVLIHMASHR